jgi:hypothetical protein
MPWPDGPVAQPPPSGAVLACCATLYANPLAELLIGESLHPGGLASTRELLRASGLGPGARLLDAGSGLGASTRLAVDEFGLVVDGVDASAEVIELARARSGHVRLRWTQADLAAMPFQKAAFDGVLAECVLSTTGRVAVLAELARVVRPHGCLVLSDVEVEPDAVPALTGHRLLGAAMCVTDAWRPGELESRLPEAGFSTERRWDLSPSIVPMVDRAEARIGLASMAIRDMGLDPGLLAGSLPIKSGERIDLARVHEAADDVRAAVRRGALRYFGAVARRRA